MMDEKLLIILLSTFLPAIAVGYVLRTNGKTLNFALFGGTLVYVVSVAMTFFLFWASPRINMPADDLVLLLPIIIGVLFYWLLKGSRIGDQS